MVCMDKFMEEKHIQSYYKNSSFGSGVSCVTDCGALEEYSGKLWWWLHWLLTISQAPAMSLLETGWRASWGLGVTRYICCFRSSPHGNGSECSYPGLHEDVSAMNELLAALCPRAGARGERRGGGWQQQNLLSFVVDDTHSAPFDLCCCAVVCTTGSCRYSGFLYSA